MKKTLIALTFILLMVFSLVSCGSSNQKDENVWIDGTAADYAPFDFMVADENGDLQFAGIDIYVAQYIAEYAGKELRIENMSFDYLLTCLGKGDYDFVIGAMEINEDRLQAADFSDPYYTDYPPMILVAKDQADQYKTLADFDGKSVGAQSATTKADIVNNDMPGANFVSFQVVTDMINELALGKVDAIVVDGSVALSYTASNPNLVVCEASDELGEAAPFCVAVQKGDPKGLLPTINAAIAQMIEDGKIDEFVETANAIVDSGEYEEYAPSAE